MFIVILLMFPGWSIHAQESYPRNTVYLELLGNGGAYSINYERAFSRNFLGRVGFGTSSGGWFSVGETTIVVFPIMGSYLYGDNNSKFELGGGLLVGSKEVDYGTENADNTKFTVIDLTAVIGYRYQKPEGGFLFRIGLTPFIALTGGEDAFPAKGAFLSGGISFGYAF